MFKWLKAKWAKLKSWAVAILVSIGLIASPLLFAEDLTLGWTNPTTYTDGSPLPLEEIRETRLYKQVFPLGTDLAAATRAYEPYTVINDPSVETFTDTGLTDGIHCYVGTTVSIMGIESFYSNEKCHVVDSRRPNPPQNLDIQQGP